MRKALTKSRRFSNKVLIITFVTTLLCTLVLWQLFYQQVIPYSSCIGVFDGDPSHCDVLTYSGVWQVLFYSLPMLFGFCLGMLMMIVRRWLSGEFGNKKKDKQ